MSDPVHHVLDEYIFGFSKEGEWTWLFRDEAALASFEPYKLFSVPTFLGELRFPVIFTKHMLDVTLMALVLFLVMIAVAAKVHRSIVEGRGPRGRFVNLFESVVLYVRNEMILPNIQRGLAINQ